MNPNVSIPHDDRLNRYVGWSVGAHVGIVVFFMLKSIFFGGVPIEYERAVRVDLVGLPDKVTPQDLTPAKPLPNPATAAPTPAAEPQAEAKPEVKKEASPKLLPQKKKDNDAINLDKSKSKQKDALNRLKQMEAMEKLEREAEAERARAQAEAARKLIKGNQVSSGTQLTGLSKLQAEAYIEQVEQQIRSNWSLPQWLAKKPLTARVRVRFDEKGNITSTQIVKSSGNPSFDEIVVDTVRKSSPVPPPPEKFVRMLSVEGILFGFPE